MERKRRKLLLISIVGVLTFAMSACSYREFEDGVRQDIEENIAEMGANENTAEELPEQDTTQTEDNSAAREEKIVQVGDTMEWVSPYQESMEYTIEKVEIADNIGELGLKKEDFNVQDVFQEDGTFVPCTEDESGQYKILLLTMRVKNVDFRGYMPSEEIPQLMVEQCLAKGEQLEEPQNAMFLYASYFSNHPEENREKDYFKYTLEKGKEMEYSVGWILSEKMLEKDLYYVIGVGCGVEDYRYFQLED